MLTGFAGYSISSMPFSSKHLGHILGLSEFFFTGWSAEAIAYYKEQSSLF